MRWRVKATTITNYNLWTIAPANLKSPACVVMAMEMYTRIARTQVLQRIAKNIATYVEVCILAAYGKYVALPTKSVS